jgi:hypothetical protein
MLRVIITALRNRADLILMLIVMTFMVGDNPEILFLKAVSVLTIVMKSARVVKIEEHRKSRL